MYSFIICFIALVASYFVYGKLVERVVGVDESRKTPAYRLQDGVDYIPMSKIKNFLVHFLNIAGLGPIFWSHTGGTVWSSSIFMDCNRYNIHWGSPRFLLRIHVPEK